MLGIENASCVFISVRIASEIVVTDDGLSRIVKYDSEFRVTESATECLRASFDEVPITSPNRRDLVAADSFVNFGLTSYSLASRISL